MLAALRRPVRSCRTMVELGRSSAWPEAVFHVLAHVSATAHLPASVFDSEYIAFVQRHVGPARERPLGQDAALLGTLLATHEQLARAQLIAWLFDSVEQVSGAAGGELAELQAAQVAAPELLPVLVRAGPAVEVLRCAAELELDALAELPPASYDAKRLQGGLESASVVAPGLSRSVVTPLRSLRLRGRVRGRVIWVGAPGPQPGPTLEHVIWQACHEATVGEVSRLAVDRDVGLAERAVERVAVVLLAERAVTAGRAAEHARWFSHFGAGAPSTAAERLERPAQELLAACRRRHE